MYQLLCSIFKMLLFQINLQKKTLEVKLTAKKQAISEIANNDKCPS